MGHACRGSPRLCSRRFASRTRRPRRATAARPVAVTVAVTEDFTVAVTAAVAVAVTVPVTDTFKVNFVKMPLAIFGCASPSLHHCPCPRRQKQEKWMGNDGGGSVAAAAWRAASPCQPFPGRGVGEVVTAARPSLPLLCPGRGGPARRWKVRRVKGWPHVPLPLPLPLRRRRGPKSGRAVCNDQLPPIPAVPRHLDTAAARRPSHTHRLEGEGVGGVPRRDSIHRRGPE